MDDFYLEQKMLAAYFEMQWLDKLRDDGIDERLKSESKFVPDSFITSDYPQNIAEFIKRAAADGSIAPRTVLEVGAALGRNCYELAKNFSAIEAITVVEPSHRLLSNFKRILIDGKDCEFPYIKGLTERESFHFQTAAITQVCSHINFSLIEAPFVQGVVDGQFDLSICLNVLDQCDSPQAIVDALKAATALNGILVLSCSYQWQKKHLKNMDEAVDDINTYFGDGWLALAEDDHEYKIRMNERFSLMFLTHVVAYKKVAI
ncbi:methyltransferase domain-containing protein [Celerinatantimonas yamalensis]|uniref:Methyltransferase domain-containing protein n=1 Tax=Celerinatantimonas yamalensis TaxID=559956 RepID=A0ABW9G6C0_9GAMM